MKTAIMLVTALLCFAETYLLNTVFPWQQGIPLSLLAAVAFIVMVVVIIGKDKEPLT